MIKTEYRTVKKSKYGGEYNPDITYAVMKRVTYLDISTKYKVALNLVSVAILLTIGLVFFFPLILIPVVAIGTAYTTDKIWNDLKCEKVSTLDLGKNLRDEAGEVCETYEKLKVAADLTPEGNGIHARTYEFGSIVFNTLKVLTQLKEVNEIMDGSEKEFYGEIVQFKNQLSNLNKSGRSLIEMTASRRLDNVKQDMEFSGIKEFNEAISNETAIYRALSSGD